jgi:hypothetical protein
MAGSVTRPTSGVRASEHLSVARMTVLIGSSRVIPQVALAGDGAYIQACLLHHIRLP